MNISLTPELDTFVQQEVQTGMYHSASEVIREGLRALKERNQFRQARLDEPRNEIGVAVQQIDEKSYMEYTPEMLAQLREAVTPDDRRRVVFNWFDKHSKYKTPEERIRALDALAKANRDVPYVPDSVFDRDNIYEDRL